jgi:hypothetical protein
MILRRRQQTHRRLPGSGSLGNPDKLSRLIELTAAIGADNDRCQPFTWTKDADDLIARIKPSKN